MLKKGTFIKRGARMTEMVNHISMGLNGDGLYFELIVDVDNDVTILEIIVHLSRFLNHLYHNHHLCHYLIRFLK